MVGRAALTPGTPAATAERMQTDSMKNQTVDQLNSFLRGELSAAETYRQALSKLSSASYHSTLQECARSHEQRVDLLTREVRRLGGDPAESSGAWGAFAKLVTSSAQVFGEKAAIAALEEGEDHGRNDYQRDLNELEPAARSLVESQLLPEQLRTHGVISALKRAQA